MNSSLSVDRALDFLKKTLQINTEEVLNIMEDPAPCTERLDLLNRILRSFYDVIPFQNIILMSTPLNERRKPTAGVICDEVIAGRGGMCYVKNVFFKLLMETIGFKVNHIGATFNVPNTHIITAAYDIKEKGDMYLVEAGCGYPIFEAIPFDFKQESPVYHHSYLTYKFVVCDRYKNGLPVHELWFRKHSHDPNVEDETYRGDGWWRLFFFTLEKMEFESFDSVMTDVYTCPGVTPFHENLIMNSYPISGAVSLRNFTLLIETSKSSEPIRDTIVEDDDVAYENCVEQHFPKLLPYVSEALKNLKNAKEIEKNNQ